MCDPGLESSLDLSSVVYICILGRFDRIVFKFKPRPLPQLYAGFPSRLSTNTPYSLNALIASQ